MSSINGLITPKLQHSLRGLTIDGGFRWCKSALDCIASLTALTSLQLLQIRADGPSGMPLDLSVLAKLKHIVKFAMQFPQDPLLQVKFAVAEQQQDSSSSGSSRRHSGGGKRGKKQQKVRLMMSTACCGRGSLLGIFQVAPTALHASAFVWPLSCGVRCATDLQCCRYVPFAAAVAGFLISLLYTHCTPLGPSQTPQERHFCRMYILVCRHPMPAPGTCQACSKPGQSCRACS
jgi:hypothetical protein